MSGRDKSGKFVRAIKQRGGIEWIANSIQGGRSLRSIAAEIGCGRWWLDRWIYADPGRRARTARARVAAAGPKKPGGCQTMGLKAPVTFQREAKTDASQWDDLSQPIEATLLESAT